MNPKDFGTKEIERLRKLGVTNLDAHIAYLLIEGVPQAYHPTEGAIAMAAACGRSSHEGSIIRAFHKDRYNIDNMFIVGCDSREIPPEHQDYDLHLSYVNGDVRFADSWEGGLISAREDKRKYDFVLINFPPLMVKMDPWPDIIRRGLQFLSEEGVIAVTGMDADLPHLSTLQDILSESEEIALTPVQNFRYVGRSVTNYGLLSIQKNH